MTTPDGVENPFSAVAVGGLRNTGAATVMTPAIREINKRLDGYLSASGPASGEVIAVIGGFGTGKTHLAVEARYQAPLLVEPTPVVCYLEGSLPLINGYRRLVDILGESHVRALAEQVDLSGTGVSTEFAIALTLLAQPDHAESAWHWLTGGEPDAALRDRGVTTAIDGDIAAVEGMITLAFLHSARGIKFVMLMDDMDAWPTGPERLFGGFAASGSLLVLLALPSFLEGLSAAARERIDHIVRMPSLVAEDVVDLIQRTQFSHLGESRLEPFTVESVHEVVAVSGGVARAVIRLCHWLYRQATFQGVPVDPAMVRQAAVELRISKPAEPEVLPPVEKTDVKWFHDAPASEDMLKRDALATVLASHIARSKAEHPHVSLMVHVDGAWGTGKSTLLRLLEKRLSSEGFLVVEFDAWQQSRLSPPWWALLTAVRNAVVDERTGWARFWLAVKERAARARRSGAAFLLSLTLLVVFAGGRGCWSGR
ncbi:P-loop NTPase fold protein [Actinophytocola sp.]|uniref:P-loop NTPase fold protein n=1 Tax=Actinophytocola sp. TaxID=1872138 RepID=UPI002ED4C7CC